MEFDGQLLKNVDKIRHIPTTIVQGRYDLVCPMDTAWELHKVKSFFSLSRTVVFFFYQEPCLM